MSDNAALIEVTGDEWAVRLDLSAAPRFAILALVGKASPVRTQARLEILRDHMPRDPHGRFCPLIADQLEQAPPSLDSLKAGRAFMESLAPEISFIVFLVSPERLQSHLMDVNLEMLNHALPGRYAFVTSIEDALTEIDDYHRREA